MAAGTAACRCRLGQPGVGQGGMLRRGVAEGTLEGGDLTAEAGQICFAVHRPRYTRQMVCPSASGRTVSSHPPVTCLRGHPQVSSRSRTRVAQRSTSRHWGWVVVVIVTCMRMPYVLRCAQANTLAHTATPYDQGADTPHGAGRAGWPQTRAAGSAHPIRFGEDHG